MTIKALIKKNEKRVRYYIGNTGKREKVYCDYISFLFLKLCYSKYGLTINQYEAYRKYIATNNNK